MKKCAFLSMDNLDDFVVYDQMLYEPLAAYGWEVEEVSWRNPNVNWNQYDVVIIRSPWDYQDDHQAFLEVLKQIDQSSALLENSLETVKWNIDKTYLRDLASQGIEIVPTLWYDRFEDSLLPDFFNELDSEEIVIKPTVSAGAEDTFRILKSEKDTFTDQLVATFGNRPFMVQPFMDKIVTEGEFSVFYFGDTYSHTILKTPKKQDFRVQEEHGGRLKTVEPEDELIQTANQIFETMDPKPLYTRADYVRTPDNTFALMELELIEPSLYFNMDPQSPERFARIFNQRMQEKLPSLS